MTIMERLKALGFEHEQTGGGCVALTRYFGEGDAMRSIMVTGADGADLPSDDSWFFGCYVSAELGEAFLLKNSDDGDDMEDGIALVAAMEAMTLPAPLYLDITDRPSAEAWINALNAADLMFHFDDDPADLITIPTDRTTHVSTWPRCWTDIEAALISHRLEGLYRQDWGDLECPIGYALTLVDAEFSAVAVEPANVS